MEPKNVDLFVGDSLNSTPEEMGYEKDDLFVIGEWISDEYKIISFIEDPVLGSIAQCTYIDR